MKAMKLPLICSNRDIIIFLNINIYRTNGCFRLHVHKLKLMFSSIEACNSTHVYLQSTFSHNHSTVLFNVACISSHSLVLVAN